MRHPVFPKSAYNGGSTLVKPHAWRTKDMNPIIVANWKMNPQTLKGAFELTKAVRKGVRSANANVVLCPPYVFIPQLLAAKNMEIGAQNCSWQEQGPLTGEVSPRQ